jgi:hypothetical protein
MTQPDTTPMTHEIRLNGEQLIKGDETSIAVIFYNLSGRNFENPRPWETGTHHRYLAYMASEFGVSFSGARIELAAIGATAIDSHQYQ